MEIMLFSLLLSPWLVVSSSAVSLQGDFSFQTIGKLSGLGPPAALIPGDMLETPGWEGL